MKNKVLIISTCKEKLHELEFVKPIEDILRINNITYFSKHHGQISKKDLEKCSQVILTGTSLKDNSFLINQFNFLKSFDRPILGICAGMQILGNLYKGKIKKKTEIGFFKETFKKEFLGLKGEKEVYHLHNNFIDFETLEKFEVISSNDGISQAVKHKEKPFYGVLFHPEVRNKELILKFVKNG